MIVTFGTFPISGAKPTSRPVLLVADWKRVQVFRLDGGELLQVLQMPGVVDGICLDGYHPRNAWVVSREEHALYRLDAMWQPAGEDPQNPVKPGKHVHSSIAAPLRFLAEIELGVDSPPLF